MAGYIDSLITHELNDSELETEKFKEPILTEESNRFVIFPIDKRYEDLWKLYKTHESAFWRAEEIDYSADLKEYQSLNKETRVFIEYILAFFAGSDGIVIENLITNFGSEVKISEARAFYGFQTMIENVHGLTYALLIDTFVKNPEKKNKLFNAIDEMPVVTKKADWALRWISSSRPFAVRLIAFAVVEGIFFSGSFCAIFWLKDKGVMVKALGHSNELIARDEGLHCEFAVKLFHHLIEKPPEYEVQEIFREAVNLEKEFICEAISCDMIGMNKDMMSQYIEYVADRLLKQLHYKPLYNVENPFTFMDKIGLDGKSNFFEKRVSEYQLGSKSIKLDDNSFDLDGDF
jgi:ribonucleotide reductase beta subunit family protein with ferritin-like domain